MSYEHLLSDKAAEMQRLRLQAQVWEPDGFDLLQRIGKGTGKKAIDIGCGAMGWLRILSRWVGEEGDVVGTDITDAMIEAAKGFVEEEKLENVIVIKDDLFDTGLPKHAFDLVHARFQICPLGRANEQMKFYSSILKPKGTLVLEDPDSGSWHYNPSAPALEQLIRYIRDAFQASATNFDVGRELPQILRDHGFEPQMRAVQHALPPKHPYLRSPLQLATSLEKRMLELIDETNLRELRETAERELEDPLRWGTTFTVIQAWGTKK